MKTAVITVNVRKTEHMKITVKLFARASQLARASEVEVEVDGGASVADFRKALEAQHPKLKPIAGSLFVAIDSEYSSDDQVILETAQIACFPPVSGG